MKLFSPSTEFDPSPEYAAACHGPPLRTMANRYKAEEDGYFVNRQFDCIDKVSYEAEAKWRAQSAAANTPEALARQREEFAAADARRAAERERELAAEAAAEEASRPQLVLRRVDANTASLADITSVISVGPEVAAQVVTERTMRRFASWDDMVARVAGLSAAQSALYASVSGLTVDGRSMDGAPVRPDIAALIYEQQHGRRAVVTLAAGERPPETVSREAESTLLTLQAMLQSSVRAR